MPSTIPKAIGPIPRKRTRYTGRTLATISDEMSVRRLVSPKAQTVLLTVGSQLFCLDSLPLEAGLARAGTEPPRGFRQNTLGQSIEYMPSKPSACQEKSGVPIAEDRL